MRKLLKMGLVVPLLVLALAFTGLAVQAADQAQNDKKELNQDLNKDLNQGERTRVSSAGDRIIDSDEEVITRTVTADEGINARRGSLERRGREATRSDVSLASDREKWWNNNYHTSNDYEDEGGDEGDDEGGGETPTYP